MLIATAGHIDHGKTTLVRALTGVDTDRLPQEKARGISIELGFAYWRPEPDLTVGFVDVPGHERFVRTMLAGAGGVDFALLVIAADDGIMPQTCEHLEILGLLGITRGAVALTKVDRAAPDLIARRKAEVAHLLDKGPLAGSPVFAVNAAQGTGLADLSKHLAAAARACPDRATDGPVRMAIDRVFVRTGAGTVVSGTLRSGIVHEGDQLILAPAGQSVRARGLQSAGVPLPSISAGSRLAINLAGIDHDQVHRGDWLVAEAAARPTTCLIARISMLPSRNGPLRHGATVHIHHGTADRSARVLLPGRCVLEPGQSALAKLVLGAPVAALAGDRMVLRDGAGRSTLGGGTVVDPFAPSRRRAATDARAAAIDLALNAPNPNARTVLEALLAGPSGIADVDHFAAAMGIGGDHARVLAHEVGALVIGDSPAMAITEARMAALGTAVIAALADHHACEPASPGLSGHQLARGLAAELSETGFTAVLRHLRSRGTIASAGALWRLSGHEPAWSPAERALWHEVTHRLEANGAASFTLAELARELGTGDAALKAMLARRIRTGEVWQVGERRLMLRDEAMRLVGIAADLVQTQGAFSAAQFRDAAGIGRNLVIDLLETFDRRGITRRSAEARTMRKDWQDLLD